MKIVFPEQVIFGKPVKLVVELSAADVRGAKRGPMKAELRLVAPGFLIAPGPRRPVSMAGGTGKRSVTYTLTAVEPKVIAPTLRVDFLVNGVLAASASATTIVFAAHEPVLARKTTTARARHKAKAVGRITRRVGVSPHPAAGSRGPVRRKMMARKKGGGGGGSRASKPVAANGGGGGPTRGVRAKPPAPPDSVSREPRIEFHELIEAGKESDLTVKLSDAITSAERELITVDIPAGEESVELTVRLSAPGFAVKPKSEKTLKVGRTFDPKREQVTFKLTARDPGKTPVTREIRADFWLGNNCLGAATHRTQVIPAGYKGPVQPDGTGRHTAFELQDNRTECDLVIIVESTNDDGQPPYEIHLRSRIPGADYESRRMGKLAIKPKALSTTLDGVFSKFPSAFPTTGKKKDEAAWRDNMRDAVEKLGKYLWGQLPQKFQQEYFRLKDANQLPASIQVHSDEMLIPWELLIPHRTDGKAEVLKPLGRMHVMGRWRPGLGIQPRPQRMRVTNGRIVNPKYNQTQLLWSILEAADLKSKLPVFKTLDPANRAEFKKLLKSTDVQMLHYTGHARYTAKQADLSSLELQGGDELDAMDVVAAELFSKGRALVYLNACEAGNVGVAMGQMGGFAVQCLTSGSSGVIAPYWAVVDETAKDFSLGLYEMLNQGRSIGEALKELRLKNPKDPTFQAFSYFGDPWTRLQF